MLLVLIFVKFLSITFNLWVILTYYPLTLIRVSLSSSLWYTAYPNTIAQIFSAKNITVLQAHVATLLLHPHPTLPGKTKVKGVTLSTGEEIHASAVVITTGTFLGGVTFVGLLPFLFVCTYKFILLTPLVSHFIAYKVLSLLFF